MNLGRVAAISPHLDDSILGCGDVLADNRGAISITVFAGRPESYGPLSAWDARCGFHEGDDVVALRREEDERALGLLGASPVWLDFLDSQYSDPPEVGLVSAELVRVLRQAKIETVLFPCGLGHPDHLLTHEATMRVVKHHRELAVNWLMYAESPYRSQRTDGVEARLNGLRAAGVPVERWMGPRSQPALKQQALEQYVSQLIALREENSEDWTLPEDLYCVQPPPHQRQSSTAADCSLPRVERVH